MGKDLNRHFIEEKEQNTKIYEKAADLVRNHENVNNNPNKNPFLSHQTGKKLESLFNCSANINAE